MTGAAVRYAGNRLAVRGLDGTFGRSRIEGGAMELALGPEPAVRAASANAVLVLDEFYPWLASLDRLQRPASAIPHATGTVAMRLIRLAGALNVHAALDYDAVIRPFSAGAQPLRTPCTLRAAANGAERDSAYGRSLTARRK